MPEVGSNFVSILPSAKGFGKSLDAQIGRDLDSSGKAGGKRFMGGFKLGFGAVAGSAGATLFRVGPEDAG